METLKPGTGQKGWSTTAVCSGNGNGGGGCGATLRVEQGDLFTTTTNVRDETTTFVTFKCHDCGVLTDLCETGHGIVPSSIAQGLPTQRAWIAATT